MAAARGASFICSDGYQRMVHLMTERVGDCAREYGSHEPSHARVVLVPAPICTDRFESRAQISFLRCGGGCCRVLAGEQFKHAGEDGDQFSRIFNRVLGTSWWLGISEEHALSSDGRIALQIHSGEQVRGKSLRKCLRLEGQNPDQPDILGPGAAVGAVGGAGARDRPLRWIMEKICSLSLSRPSCCRAESSVAGWLICLLSVNRGRSLSWESVTTKNCGTLSVMEELSMTCRCVFRA